MFSDGVHHVKSLFGVNIEQHQLLLLFDINQGKTIKQLDSHNSKKIQKIDMYGTCTK